MPKKAIHELAPKAPKEVIDLVKKWDPIISRKGPRGNDTDNFRKFFKELTDFYSFKENYIRLSGIIERDKWCEVYIDHEDPERRFNYTGSTYSLRDWHAKDMAGVLIAFGEILIEEGILEEHPDLSDKWLARGWGLRLYKDGVHTAKFKKHLTEGKLRHIAFDVTKGEYKNRPGKESHLTY